MKKQGFTIVELLIVIVVIGILAAISIVSYNGISANARNAGRIQELKQWQKHFELYKAQNGEYPVMANGGYCLGTGFPSGSGGGNVPRCRDWKSTGVYSNVQSDNISLMSALTAVSPLPTGTRSPIGSYIGPYADYTTSVIVLNTFIEGKAKSDCPSGTNGIWTNASAVLCVITLTK